MSYGRLLNERDLLGIIQYRTILPAYAREPPMAGPTLTLARMKTRVRKARGPISWPRRSNLNMPWVLMSQRWVWPSIEAVFSATLSRRRLHRHARFVEPFEDGGLQGGLCAF
jgi:hypothetical protein